MLGVPWGGAIEFHASSDLSPLARELQPSASKTNRPVRHHVEDLGEEVGKHGRLGEQLHLIQLSCPATQGQRGRIPMAKPTRIGYVMDDRPTRHCVHRHTLTASEYSIRMMFRNGCIRAGFRK